MTLISDWSVSNVTILKKLDMHVNKLVHSTGTSLNVLKSYFIWKNPVVSFT